MAAATRTLFRSRADQLRHLTRDISGATREHVLMRRSQVESVAARLNALSPLATLARGYAVARGADGKTLDSIARFHDNMPFDLIVRDGVVAARVDGPRREHPR